MERKVEAGNRKEKGNGGVSWLGFQRATSYSENTQKTTTKSMKRKEEGTYKAKDNETKVRRIAPQLSPLLAWRVSSGVECGGAVGVGCVKKKNQSEEIRRDTVKQQSFGTLNEWHETKEWSL